MSVRIPISVGEFLDRLTILELKLGHAPEGAVKDDIRDQVDQFRAAGAPVADALEDVTPLRSELADTNARLWAVEDDLREKERLGEFDEAFINLARSVYQLNDHRAALKKQIDRQVGSDFSDTKIYSADTRET